MTFEQLIDKYQGKVGIISVTSNERGQFKGRVKQGEKDFETKFKPTFNEMAEQLEILIKDLEGSNSVE